MEEYKQAYIKLFNCVTDLTAKTQGLVAEMKSIQQACEEIIIGPGETLPSSRLEREGDS